MIPLHRFAEALFGRSGLGRCLGAPEHAWAIAVRSWLPHGRVLGALWASFARYGRSWALLGAHGGGSFVRSLGLSNFARI